MFENGSDESTFQCVRQVFRKTEYVLSLDFAKVTFESEKLSKLPCRLYIPKSDSNFLKESLQCVFTVCPRPRLVSMAYSSS